MDRNTIYSKKVRTSSFAIMLRVVVAGLVLIGAAMVVRAAPPLAPDAVKADPKHYKVEFENDQVRVLRIHYDPHDKSVMHSHPAGVAVFLTDFQGRFTMPDGKTRDLNGNAGNVLWEDAVAHQPENTGDKAFELILVELKKPRARK